MLQRTQVHVFPSGFLNIHPNSLPRLFIVFKRCGSSLLLQSSDITKKPRRRLWSFQYIYSLKPLLTWLASMINDIGCCSTSGLSQYEQESQFQKETNCWQDFLANKILLVERRTFPFLPQLSLRSKSDPFEDLVIRSSRPSILYVGHGNGNAEYSVFPQKSHNRPNQKPPSKVSNI